MENRVVAVVVTYNRLEYLKRLISSLRKQTVKVSKIIIINNGSNDGTLEWLNEQNDLDFITQENVGSAGGQYTAFKTVLELDYEYIWTMDDDGFPSDNCLEKLLDSEAHKTMRDSVVIGSVIVNPENPIELSFNVPVLETFRKFTGSYLKNTKNLSYILEYESNLGFPHCMIFNSILFPKKVITTIGLPKRELFIWGDEVEYLERIKYNNIKTFLIKESIFFHPRVKNNGVVKWKEKYAIRNSIYIILKYYPIPYLKLMKRLFDIIVKGEFYLLVPFWHGVTGNFNKKYFN